MAALLPGVMAALPSGYAVPRRHRLPVNDYTPSRSDVVFERGRIEQHILSMFMECIDEDQDMYWQRAASEHRPLTVEECDEIDACDEVLIAHFMSYDKVLR